VQRAWADQLVTVPFEMCAKAVALKKAADAHLLFEIFEALARHGVTRFRFPKVL